MGKESAEANGIHEGRDTKGKFLPGNKLGGSNPIGGRASQIRAELLREATPERTSKIIRKLMQMAENGDLGCIKEFFDRTIGKAGQTELLQRIEALEANTVTIDSEFEDSSKDDADEPSGTP